MTSSHVVFHLCGYEIGGRHQLRSSKVCLYSFKSHFTFANVFGISESIVELLNDNSETNGKRAEIDQDTKTRNV